MKRSATTALRALAIAGTLAVACRPEAEAPRERPYELAAVVAPAIAALEREIGVDPPSAAADPELSERVRGLVLDLPTAQARMRALQLEEIASIGDPALGPLAACLADLELSNDQRLAALELCASIDTPRAAELLVSQVETAPDAWVRANAAWRLAASSQDQVVLRLLLRLKYEVDPETVIWIAHALAHFENHAGLDGLFVVMQDATRPELAASAGARLSELAGAAGVDAETLRRRWSEGDPDRAGPPSKVEASAVEPSAARPPAARPSARLQIEIWRQIARLANHDLRSVDDARFVLSRSAAWVAEPLARALHEEVVYMRVHAAQCLERMGPRARSAGPALADALDEPRLAAAAARALGAIGSTEAVPTLVARLEPREEPELRVAAAQALGSLGDPEAIASLRALLAPEEPIDLRQTAAQALVVLGQGDAVAGLLLECLISPRADASGAEAALERWLVERARMDEGAQASLERWRALAGPPGIPEQRAVLERQRARAEIVQAEIARAKVVDAGTTAAPR